MKKLINAVDNVVTDALRGMAAAHPHELDIDLDQHIVYRRRPKEQGKGAIISEVSATLALRQALNQPGFYVMVGIGYALAFILLSLTLKAGMPLGVAYGLWGALGVALTAVLSMLVFGEPITVLVALGIALIMAGVLLVEVGAQRAGTQHKDGEAS